MKVYYQILLFGLLLLSIYSCSSKTDKQILIYAAASMTDSLNEIVTEYELRNPDVKINFNYGGSQALAAQLNQGAPGDVFISAGYGPVGFLLNSDKIHLKSISQIASNKLVVVTRPSSKMPIAIEDIQSINRIAIADPDLAPAGSYAREALRNIGLWEDLTEKIVFAPDVRATLNYVRTGNVDAGIVYYTDALSVPELVKHDLISQSSYGTILYPAVIIEDGDTIAEAEALIEFIMGDFSKTILQKHGFILPSYE